MKTVRNRALHAQMQRELDERIGRLQVLLAPRALSTPREGTSGRGHWANPEQMCATTGTESQIRLAVADFQTILKELLR